MEVEVRCKQYEGCDPEEPDSPHRGFDERDLGTTNISYQIRVLGGANRVPGEHAGKHERIE